MGRCVTAAVSGADDMTVVAAVDATCVGEDAGVLAGKPALGITVRPPAELVCAIEQASPDVMVDFVVPATASLENVRLAISHRVCCVVGSTGFGSADLAALHELCLVNGTPAIVAPNFSLGANLMMRFAAEAARHFDFTEIIERHHENKKDSPSGTALKTAEMMAVARGKPVSVPETELDKAPGSRGGTHAGIPIHAVRLPGYVAHQEVVLGGLGEVLTLRHDSISRESFMPGVLLAVRKVKELQGLTVGLERLL
jgi:4-hydroxy-tetrahydrodipicolinate reductase